MLPFLIPAIGAAMGLVMGQEQKKADARARQNQALLNMYAPLFKQEVKAMDPIKEQVLPGAIGGAMRGYELQQNAELMDMLKNTQNTNLVMPQGGGNKYGLGLDLPQRSVLDGSSYGGIANQQPSFNLYSNSLAPIVDTSPMKMFQAH